MRGPSGAGGGGPRGLAVIVPVALLAILAYWGYHACKIEVPTGSQAILIRKVGLDLPKDQEIAPPAKGGTYYKGVQPGVLTEGRYFYNPYFWDWEVYEQKVVPSDKIAVRVALVGGELPDGRVLAEKGQKGVQREVVGPGRYPYNKFAEDFLEYPPVTIAPGFRGVVTKLTGAEPKDPNVVLVAEGERGVQRKTLPPGTYPINPFEERISTVDCRSRRFATGAPIEELTFLSSDGFEVRLDLTVEYRVIEDRVAEVFVLYNEDRNGDSIDEEIIAKIITPEVRSICRINGSKMTGTEFITGDTRSVFRDQLMKTLTANCKTQGIEVLPDGVSITQIYPPQEIADPVRKREVAKQNLALYQQQKDQQEVEKQLKIETMMVKRKEAIVQADRDVIEQTTQAQQAQAVAVTKAEERLSVAKTKLEAAKDQAAAVIAEAEADAASIRFDNQAQLAGLKTQVDAFEGDGAALAQNMVVTKLAPSFRTIMTNSEGALMDLFREMTASAQHPSSPGPRLRAPSPLSHAPTGPTTTAEVPTGPNVEGPNR
jgi:regulator of protease activity HflC (stomatin/prohibitin superfamily)